MCARFFQGWLAAAVLLAASLMLPDAVSAEELAPGLDACIRNAKDTYDRETCYRNARDYWRKVLERNYNEAKRRAGIQGHEETMVADGSRQATLLRFRWALDQYLDAGKCLFSGEKFDIFIVEETKRLAQLMEAYR